MRVKVTLRCNECKQRNYNTMKNKKNTPDKLELNKYCRFCKKHTLHSETKLSHLRHEERACKRKWQKKSRRKRIAAFGSAR